MLPEQANRRWTCAGLVPAAFCIAAPIAIAIWLGQDANWDLRNYHYYNPYAFLNGRMGIDLAPAQQQSFHSPFADLPFYWMTRASMPTPLVGAILALPACVSLWLLLQICRTLVPVQESARRMLVELALVFIAVGGAAGGATLGSTMSEWHLLALVLAALLLMLREHLRAASLAARSGARLPWLGAGVLAGAACGLKLTMAYSAIGLAVMVLVLPAPLATRAKRLALLATGGLIGFCVFYGPWAWVLWKHYQNPFFPYFNDLFRSDWVREISHADLRFAKRSIGELFTLPFKLTRETSQYVSELLLRDMRLALGLPLLVLFAATPLRGQSDEFRLWPALAAFTLSSYVVWAWAAGIYRYAVIIECMAALAIVGAVCRLPGAWRAPLLFFVCATIALTTTWPKWGRLAHGEPVTTLTVPNLAPRSMVVIASLEPLAYVVPSLPPEVPVVSVANNFMVQPEYPHRMRSQGLARIRQHEGPVYLMRNARQRNESIDGAIPVTAALARMGLEVGERGCVSVRSRWPSDEIEFCPIRVLRGTD